MNLEGRKAGTRQRGLWPTNDTDLNVEAQEVVHGETEASDGRFEFEGMVRAMPVVVVEENGELLKAISGMRIGVGVGPLPEGGLDEALGLAVGFWSIGLGETLLEAEGGSGRAHEMRTITRAIVGIETLRLDTVAAEEGEGGVEKSDGTNGGFVWVKLGEGEAGMIIDGNMEELPAGPPDMVGLAITGDAVSWTLDPGQFLDVEMDELAWVRSLVALDRRRRRELGQPLAMTVQIARHGGLGELGGPRDLETWQLALA